MNFFVSAIDRLLRGLAYPLFALVLLVPALTIPVAMEQPFKTAQEIVAVALAWTFLAFVVLLRQWGGRLPFPRLTAPARIVLILVPVWMAVTAFCGYNSQTSWGYLPSVVAFVGLAIATIGWIEDRPSRRGFVIAILAIEASLQVVVGALEVTKSPWVQAALNGLPVYMIAGHALPGNEWLHNFLTALVAIYKDGTFMGTLGNPNYVGELFALLIPVLAGWTLDVRSRPRKLLAGLGVGILCVALFETSCRAALLGVILGGIASLGILFDWRRLNFAAISRHRFKLLAGLASFGVLAIALGAPILHKFSFLGHDASTIQRLVNWHSTFESALRHPIAGVGLGAYKLTNSRELLRHYPHGLPALSNIERFLQAHCEPLQIFAELGLVGLLLIALGVVLWIRRVSKNELLSPNQRFGLVWGVSAVLIASCFGFPFHIAQTALVVMLVLAVGLAGQEPEQAQLPRGIRPIVALTTAALVAAIGSQAFLKFAWPRMVGEQYAYIGVKLTDEHMYPLAIRMFQVSSRLVLFKGLSELNLVKCEVNDHRYQEALAVLDADGKDGMGIEADYWRGAALEGLGRTQEAKDDYTEVMQFYPPVHPYYHAAAAKMKAIADQAAVPKRVSPKITP